MELGIIVLFVLGYILIATEHNIKIDKAATALFIGVACWTLLVIGIQEIPAPFIQDFEHWKLLNPENTLGLKGYFEHQLSHHVQEIASILLFLMGAMTIVEIIDAHNGFQMITDRITSKKKVVLLWTISILTFFLSAALDNLTTSIVMVSLIRKIIPDKDTRWLFGGIIVIAANAGGAWSPIGDVTTTMLWIGGQVTSAAIIQNLFIPSLISLIVPLGVLSFVLKGNIESFQNNTQAHPVVAQRDQKVALLLGLGGLLMVPVYKSVTHLPPFMGIMLSLGILWMATELMHGRKLDEEKSRFSALYALRKIDMPSVLFFLGILLAVGALQEMGTLIQASTLLKDTFNNPYTINLTIGLLSAIIDNVPLVAASMGMYPITGISQDPWLQYFVQDGVFWEFLAFCAGTGGSILIIGSAAGVAVMGLEKITFSWYLKKISPWALLGYLSGGIYYILLHS
ncbi:MAG: sodium:proton antiporter [Bacteroidetes bacterium]|nr:sodium:proton antiporter [Bacteroidota bacterium]